MLWLTLPALAVTLTLATGLGLMLSALNVYYRDVQHFLELGMLTWFWLTPIVYLYNFVGEALIVRWGEGAERLAMLNPMTAVVTTFQRVVYNPTNFDQQQQQENFALLFRPTSWYVQNLAISAVVSVAFLYLGFKMFTRLEANLGEEL
jgi:ABC-2 type transport system permease protein